MKRANLVVAALLAGSLPAAKQPDVDVQVIDRQDNETGYTYFVPATSTSTSTTDIGCSGGQYGSNVSCSGQTRTNTVGMPARSGGYHVTGATLSLLLVDGRIAVVNCQSKFALKGDYVNRRGCRIPMVRSIKAEFSGNSAKLKWPVSLDGTKIDSETYKIVAIQEKQ